jgi:tRNA G26 N,N-dimethylase Trm1
MGWQAAVAPALTTAAPYATAALGVAQFQQQGAAGAYNKAIADRNFRVKVQEAERIQKQLETDLVRFDKQFQKLQGQATTSIIKSGAELSGSGLRALRYNVEQAELEKDIIEYNAKVGQARKFEEANFAIIQGQMARQQARMAQLKTLTQTGTSLLSMQG